MKEDIVAHEIEKVIVRERKDCKRLKILGYELTRRFQVVLEPAISVIFKLEGE